MFISRFHLPILTLGLILSAVHLRADESDAALDADMQKMVAAVKANDFAQPVDMMYGPFVDSVGGRDKVKAQAEKSKLAMAGMGLKIDTYETVPPYKHVSTAERDYAIIPIHTVMEVEGKKVDSHTYQLAIRPHGGTKWEYLDGSGITPQVKARFFPDLKDTLLPEVKRAIIK